MTRILIHWLVSALLLLVVAHVVPGFFVAGLKGALIAAVVIGLVNATLGSFLKIITLPATLLTFGIFLIVINALMLMLVSHFMQSFHVSGFGPAFIGAFLLSLLHMIVKWVTPKKTMRNAD